MHIIKNQYKHPIEIEPRRISFQGQSEAPFFCATLGKNFGP